MEHIISKFKRADDVLINCCRSFSSHGDKGEEGGSLKLHYVLHFPQERERRIKKESSIRNTDKKEDGFFFDICRPIFRLLSTCGAAAQVMECFAFSSSFFLDE